jgi:hypothetical protein
MCANDPNCDHSPKYVVREGTGIWGFMESGSSPYSLGREYITKLWQTLFCHGTTICGIDGEPTTDKDLLKHRYYLELMLFEYLQRFQEDPPKPTYMRGCDYRK